MKLLSLQQLEKEEIIKAYRFGNIEIDEEDLINENFEFIKLIDAKENNSYSLYRIRLNKEGYIPFISLNKLITYGYKKSKIILKYEHYNIMAYIDSNSLREEHKRSNYLYLVFTSKNELCYTCVGSPINPNSLYVKKELDKIITTVERFNTLLGSNRVEINYKNNSFEKELDDIPF